MINTSNVKLYERITPKKGINDLNPSLEKKIEKRLS